MKILILLISLNSCLAFSQYDSIKGYNKFNFGETIESAKNKLNMNKINFDSIHKDSFYGDEDYKVLNYSDSIDIWINWEHLNLILNVSLQFDVNNLNKFYEAEVEIHQYSNTTNSAKEIFNELSKLFFEKYGTDYKEYDYLDSSNFLHHTGYLKSFWYLWEKTNAYVTFRLDLTDFYSIIKDSAIIGRPYYYSVPDSSGAYCKIFTNYVDSKLKEIWRKKYIEINKKKYLEKHNNNMKKF